MLPKTADTSRLFLAFDQALLRAVVEITSQRTRLTEAQSSELLASVIARLSANSHRVRELQGTVSLEGTVKLANPAPINKNCIGLLRVLRFSQIRRW